MLNISYDKFVRQASAVYGESSAYLVRNKKDKPSDEMMKEMYAIASVHQRNSKAYGVNSEPAKDFRKKSERQRNELPLILFIGHIIVSCISAQVVLEIKNATSTLASGSGIKL